MEEDSIYSCECGRDDCQRRVSESAWASLNDWRNAEVGGDGYLVHVDHVDGDKVIREHGDWRVVQPAPPAAAER